MENSSNNSAPVEASTAPAAEAASEVNSQEQQTPAEKKLSRAIKLKIEGQEYEEKLPFDFDPDNKEQVEYLKRHLQMSKVASKRMNEASVTRKQAEQFIQALQQDPMAVLGNDKIMGQAKFRQLAEQFLAQQLEAEMLSPQEKQVKEREAKLRRYEEQEKQTKADAEAKQAQAMEEHYAQEYQKTIISALETTSLPKNAFTVKRMADLMQKNLQHGLELEPSMLAKIVKEDYQKELVGLIGGSDAEQILAMFGDDVANKIRKADLAKLKAGQFQSKAPSNQVVPNQPKPNGQPLSMSEWRRQNGHG